MGQNLPHPDTDNVITVSSGNLKPNCGNTKASRGFYPWVDGAETLNSTIRSRSSVTNSPMNSTTKELKRRKNQKEKFKRWTDTALAGDSILQKSTD